MDEEPAKETICLGFDGVLNDRSGGYVDPTTIDANPTDGAREFIELVTPHYHVEIVSSRGVSHEGFTAMRQWCIKHYGFEWLQQLGITMMTGKPPAHIYLDARALKFQGPGYFPTLEEIHAFKAWYEYQ